MIRLFAASLIIVQVAWLWLLAISIRSLFS